MKFGDLTMLAETHLNDLQAGLEAGSRRVDHINQAGAQLREALFANHLKQADLLGSLLRQLGELQSSFRQQRETMRHLRHDIREMRRLTTNDD